MRALLVAVIYCVFFLSGVAALAYEISWSRQIGLLFGHTVAAAATVLASYFFGLALGYWLGGKFVVKSQRPLLWYGLFEITAGLGSLLVPWALAWLHTETFAPLIHQSTPTLQLVIRASVCLLIMLPATTALGATLPMMACWLESTNPGNTNRIAWAYGLNTCGGLVGVLLTTIVLLSTVGVSSSNFLAAALSGFCGILAITCHLVSFLEDGRFASSVPPPNEGTFEAVLAITGEQPPTLSCQGELLSKTRLSVLVGVSGFVTLAVEVLYTRLFALVFHNSTYTFGLVIAVVLAGLAIGSWIAAWAGGRYDARAIARWAMLLAGGAIGVSTLVFLQRTGLCYFDGGDTFATYMSTSLGLVALVVLPPITLLGMVLPLLWKVALARNVEIQKAETATTVGRLTAINTLAAAAGALVASFVLLPLLDLWGSFALLAMLCVAASLLLLESRTAEEASSGSSNRIGYASVLISIVCVSIAAWQFAASQSGVPPRKELLLRKTGAYGWIDVVRTNRTGTLSLRENVNYTHGSTASAQWEQRQGHIPLLLHPDPKSVLFLGCGTGATAGSATLHPEVESIAIAELIPEVIAAAALFESSNLGVLSDPRTEVFIDDARHTLLASDRQYDVIISDLFVPWESKTGYLYTVDHYLIARQRLRPGGIFCQWLAMWQLGDGEFEMIADGFSEVFPYTTLWWDKVEFDRSIVGLIGSEQPLRIDGQTLSLRLADLHKQTAIIDRRIRSPEDLGRLFIGRWHPSGARLLNTDEHPRLEFSMPLTYADHETLKRRTMQSYYQDVLAKLTADGVEFSDVDRSKVEPDARRAWQKLQLRK